MLKLESTKVGARNLLSQQRSLDTLAQLRLDKDDTVKESIEIRNQRWIAKTKISPYSIDLVAEGERALEELKIKSNNRRPPFIETDEGIFKAKNDTISIALAEFSELDALRREKRAILEEEQRLKALLVLEKTKNSTRESRMIAERAQKQRQLAKIEHRRSLYQDSLSAIIAEESAALRRKHGL